jgi:hypothetical protein
MLLLNRLVRNGIERYGNGEKQPAFCEMPAAIEGPPQRYELNSRTIDDPFRLES